MILAREITSLYNGRLKAEEAENRFKEIFQKKQLPVEMPIIEISEDDDLIKLIIRAGFSKSSSEARRLITQGAVKINGEKIIDATICIIKNDDVLQVGKRRFVRTKKI